MIHMNAGHNSPGPALCRADRAQFARSVGIPEQKQRYNNIQLWLNRERRCAERWRCVDWRDAHNLQEAGECSSVNSWAFTTEQSLSTWLKCCLCIAANWWLTDVKRVRRETATPGRYFKTNYEHQWQNENGSLVHNVRYVRRWRTWFMSNSGGLMSKR